MRSTPTRRRRDPVRTITTLPRRPVGGGARRGRRLFHPGAVASARSAGARWKAVLVCFAAAVLLLVAAFALPLATSTKASADVDAASRAAAEAAQLESASGSTARSASLDMPALAQNPELPTGCESLALTNALIACGFDLAKTEIAAAWLPRSETNFVNAFLGNPFSADGHSVMAPGLARTAAAYLAAHGSSLQAVDRSGASFEDVLREVAAGHPAIVWCTIGLEEPGDCYRTAQVEGRTYRLLTNSHCVVVSGYDLDTGTVQVSDSLAGQTAYPLETLAARYYALGAQAVVLR